jgi:cell wall-associated NlpC family hydrolase
MVTRRRPVRALSVVATVALLAAFGTSAAHADPVYPSWQDVENARGDAAATSAQVARIQGLIDDLESAATAISVDALKKGELYNQARDELDATDAKATALEKHADDAAALAAQSAARAGQLISELVRTGGGNLTVQLLVDAGDADDLLSQLGTMSKLTEQSAAVIERARADENAARSLADQAEVARAEREKLTGDAAAVLEQANAAAAAAEMTIATQAAAANQLKAQLVSLTGNADAVEQGYRDGLAGKTANGQAQGSSGAPATSTPVTAPTPGTPVTAPPATTPPATAPPVTAPVVIPPVVAPPTSTPPPASNGAAAGAIAFAYAQLGDAYLFGGSGPNAWDCSGLTKSSYASVGVNIGTHSASNQYTTLSKAGRLVPVGQRVAGDLLFYATGGAAGGEKYHTTIYIGGGQMIEAPRPGVVVRVAPVRSGDLVPYAGRPTG